MTYRYVTDDGEPHLGGNISVGDPMTFSPGVCRYLVERFAVRSVLDLGSGLGHAADLFHRLGCRVVAVDGLLENVRKAFYPTVLHDLTASGPFITEVDLVYCVEVVEHVDPMYMSYLVGSLRSGRVLFMTHAFPGQDGHHHVNCQQPDYWVERLAPMDYLDLDTRRVRNLAMLDWAEHLARSGLVFARGR